MTFPDQAPLLILNPDLASALLLQIAHAAETSEAGKNIMEDTEDAFMASVTTVITDLVDMNVDHMDLTVLAATAAVVKVGVKTTENVDGDTRATSMKLQAQKPSTTMFTRLRNSKAALSFYRWSPSVLLLDSHVWDSSIPREKRWDLPSLSNAEFVASPSCSRF